MRKGGQEEKGLGDGKERREGQKRSEKTYISDIIWSACFSAYVHDVSTVVAICLPYVQFNFLPKCSILANFDHLE